MSRLLAIFMLLLTSVGGHAATYRGRVQYASTGKAVPNVIVEARSRSGLNLLFFAPQVPFIVLERAVTRADGTFQFKRSQNVLRLRFAARGQFMEAGMRRWDREITAPSANSFNIIAVPDDFQPWHPKHQKKI